MQGASGAAFSGVWLHSLCLLRYLYPHYYYGERSPFCQRETDFFKKKCAPQMRDAPLSVKLCIAAIARLFFLPVYHLRGGVAAVDAQLAVDAFGVILYGIL